MLENRIIEDGGPGLRYEVQFRVSDSEQAAIRRWSPFVSVGPDKGRFRSLKAAIRALELHRKAFSGEPNVVWGPYRL